MNTRRHVTNKADLFRLGMIVMMAATIPIAGCGTSVIPQQCAGTYDFTWRNSWYEVNANVNISANGNVVGSARDAASGEFLFISGTVSSNGRIDGTVEYTELGQVFSIDGFFDATSCFASGTAEGGTWVAVKTF